VQSIEHTLRNLDKLAIDQQNRVTRIEKELADYRVQADRPFEHEERLKQLLARQAELNSVLDLDKGDQQGVAPIPDEEEREIKSVAPVSPDGRYELVTKAEAYMRMSGAAIREIPVSERSAPQMGQVTGRVVAKDEANIAFATAANTFVVVASTSLGRDLEIGERLSLRFHQGRASIDNGRNRGR
jgi:hypothetical protein